MREKLPHFFVLDTYIAIADDIILISRKCGLTMMLPKQPFHSSNWQRTLYIMFFAQMMTAVGFSSIFPFLPLYVKDLGSAYGLSIELLAGLVYSAQGFTMMLASPVWGSLADRMGRKIMVERAMFSGAIILFIMAFVRSAEELVMLRAIQGALTGTIAAANALVAAEVPRTNMGYAMGLLQVGFGAGIALGPVIGGIIADQLGYAQAFYVTSALLTCAGLLVLFGVKENKDSSIEGRKQKTGIIRSWRKIIRSQGVGVAYTLRFMTSLGRMMIIPIAPLFVEILVGGQDGVNTITGLMVGIGYATTTLSSLWLGKLGDKVGHHKIILATLLAAGVLYFPQSLVSDAYQLLVLQGLVGIALGGIIPTISALLARLISPGGEGAAYGLDNSVNSAARSIAPLLGAGVASWFGIRATFSATGLFFLLSFLVAFLYLPRLASDETNNIRFDEA